MKISIEFETENAAFEDDLHGESASLLRDLARKIQAQAVPFEAGINIPLRDSNGNRVGFCRIQE